MISRTVRWGVIAAIVLAAAWPMLVGRRVAFRDVNHFYLPLYEYVADRTSTEWLPLWNPLDHTGMPLLGETSTAVLYPIRYAVFLLPIATEWSMNVYLIVHLLLASATAAWLAKRIGCQPLGIAVTALVYPLSGSVFSLCCNPPFLVGAAWIPLALGACLTRENDAVSAWSLQRKIAWAAIALSMMVLGGDPQSALHCVLAIVGISICSGFSQLRLAKSENLAWSRCPGIRSAGVCLAASLLALGVCAAQIAASVDWSRQSNRVGGKDGRREVYEFSLAPWHAIECVTPRPFGHLFPINRRVAKLIPGEGRMWTPSIYAGMVVGFALLSRLSRPRSYFADPWFAVAIVSLLLCFGHFGLVWVLQQFPGAFPQTSSAVGGPYWMLCQLVPGYDSFRYPVKWLPMFSIASSLIAGRWISSRPCRQEQLIAIALLVLFVIGAAYSQWLCRHTDQIAWLRQDKLPVDEYWGPLEVSNAFALIRTSYLWSLAGLSVLVGLRSMGPKVEGESPSRWLAVVWVVFVGFDGGCNASHLLPTVDVQREQTIAHQASPPPIGAERTLRTQSGSWPQRWRESVSGDRAIEVSVSERIAWFGRWHLASRQAVFNSMVSIQSRSYGEFWAETGHHLAGLDRQQRIDYWRSVRGWLAIGAVSHVDQTKSIAADGLSLVFVQRRVTQPVNRLRVFTRWLPEQPMSEVVKDVGRSEGLPLPHVAISPPQDLAGARASVLQQDSGRIEVRCNARCVLERTVLQDGNWQAQLESQSGDTELVVQVFPSSHLNQAVEIPRGIWTVRFEYRPWWRWPAAAISGLAVIVLSFLLFLPNQRVFSAVRGIVFFSIPGRLLEENN